MGRDRIKRYRAIKAKSARLTEDLKRTRPYAIVPRPRPAPTSYIATRELRAIVQALKSARFQWRREQILRESDRRHHSASPS